MNSKNDPKNIDTLSRMALHIAQKQLGQSEQPIGSNSGPMVNEYLKSVGLAPGYAWCQAFVYWCYAAAAKELNKPNPVTRTANVHECWDKAVTNNTTNKLTKAEALKQPSQIKAGDQFILFFGGNAGHTGIVEKVEGSVIHTIEGNSNNIGSREGYEVVRHQRDLSDKALQGFIQYL